MKAFIMSQFSYCPLVWMCHSRTLNNKINKLRERALRLVYDDRQSTYQELLNINKSVTIHHRNLQALATELYKVQHGLAPGLFRKRDVTNNFRNNSTLETRNTKSVFMVQKQYPFSAPKCGNFCQVTLKIQKILTSSNHILNLGSLKTVHAICADYILQYFVTLY